MTEYASVEALTVDQVADNARDVSLPGGQVVRVRGLSRMELLLAAKHKDDAAAYERAMVAFCMLEPRMTVKQVEAWQRASGPTGAMVAVTEAIRELSGLGEGAQKSSEGAAGEPGQ